MLSLGSQKPFAGVNLGLDNSFAAQSQQAQQALDLTDAQYKLISQLQDPSTSLAYQQRAATAGANVPQMRFGGNDFAEGLGNGINNFYAMKGYNQQQQTFKDIATQQHAYQQNMLQMAQQQIQADANRRAGGKKELPIGLQSSYQYLSPEAQDKVLADEINKRLNVSYKPIEAEAESKATIQADQAKLNWQRERFHALTGTYPEKLFAMGNQGALTPQMQSAWKYVYNSDPPKDALDFQERYAKVASSVEGAKGAAIDNQTRGQQNQAGLDSTLLDNATKQVNLKYAEALKQADMLVAQGKADEAQKLKENLDQGMLRFNQATQQYAQMTQGQISLFNSQMKAIGLPYELPDKEELKAVTKDGKVTQFYDPYTGQVKLAPQK